VTPLCHRIKVGFKQKKPEDMFTQYMPSGGGVSVDTIADLAKEASQVCIVYLQQHLCQGA
jgi:hypothetical protein